MVDGFSYFVLLVEAAAIVVGTLGIVSLCRLRSYRRWCYLFLVFYELAWVRILDQVFALVGVPRAWRDGVEGVLFALVVVTLVLLYRHRHDPDPEDADTP